MLTFLKSSSPVLFTISSMSLPMCNHFHVRRPNISKITSFIGDAPVSHPRSRRTLSPSGMKFGHEILETLGYHTVKTMQESLSYLDSDRYQDLTEKTD